jgi:hypothetical protein
LEQLQSLAMAKVGVIAKKMPMNKVDKIDFIVSGTSLTIMSLFLVSGKQKSKRSGPLAYP